MKTTENGTSTADTQDYCEEMRVLAERVCTLATKAGAQHAAANAGMSRSRKVVVRDGLVEEVKASTSRGISIRVYVDGRYGAHSTSDLTSDSLERFVDRAVSMTRVLMPDEHRALPESHLYTGRRSDDLGVYDPAHAEWSATARMRRARASHDAAREAAGDHALSVMGGASDGVSWSALVNTNGFSDVERYTSAGVSAMVNVSDPSGKRPSDWFDDSTRVAPDSLDVIGVGQTAAKRALAQIGAEEPSSMELPLIVENRAIGRLLGGYLSPLSGHSLDQKRSCFADALGTPIAASCLNIIDDPFVIGGWGSSHFDGEGLTARRQPLIEDGNLRRYFIDTYYGRKLGMEPSGGGTFNLLFELGGDDLDGLMKRAGRALLVTSFLGGNSNGTTGDFSHGLRGFLVEDGVPVTPVSGLNLSGNHKEFWHRLVALGNDPNPGSSTACPSMLFEPMLVAG
jgi:PmbA protein